MPDKDADGLASGAILQRTLLLLGLDPALIAVHLPQKGGNIHEDAERVAMAAHEPAYIFVLDHGARKSRPVIDAPHQALVIDHHYALDDDFPEGAEHVTACNSPPVATSSLLTYHICSALHDDVPKQCDWLCVMGTHGDLGNSFIWEPPFPDMKATFKKYTKKAHNDAVSLINAPRRTAEYDVASAWRALTAADSPRALLDNQVLLDARAAVNAAVRRCTRIAPKFSADKRFAVFRIHSEAQVHPVVATIWASYLDSAELEVIMVANEGFMPDRVHFSCRVPRSARARDPPVNLLHALADLVDRSPDPTLRARLGDNFGKGHVQASGGIVPKKEFEELMELLAVGTKTPKKTPKKKAKKAAPMRPDAES